MKIKNLLLAAGTSIFCLFITISFTLILNLYLLNILFEKTQTKFNKYLIFKLHPIDNWILCFYPLLFIYPILLRKSPFIKTMLMNTFLGLLMIFLCFIAGYFIALNTWTSNGVSSLLPDYVKYQPYSYYWTLFILSGIVFPFLRLFYKTNKTEEGVIDAT
jgi:hypothetical protein